MSNMIVEQFGILDMTHALRHSMLDMLTDEDLQFQLPGNKTLGEVCYGMVATGQMYIDSFTTLKMDWMYRPENSDELVSSVNALKDTFAAQEKALKDVLRSFSNEDLHSKQIDRGGFSPSAFMQFGVYREALLMFYAKASIYLRAMDKDLPEQWRTWVG